MGHRRRPLALRGTFSVTCCCVPSASRADNNLLTVGDLPQDERQNKRSQSRDYLVMASNGISNEEKKTYEFYSGN
jgi:hypothetical protein